MRERPIYVGILCWYLIIVNAWALVHSFTLVDSPYMQNKMAQTPLPVPVQEAKYFLSLLVPLVTAMFMTEGVNWGRVVYIAWGIANYLLEAIVTPDRQDLQPGLDIFAVFAILLLIPRSRGYFLLERFHS